MDWQERGAAFPYLMHHPGFVQTETYGSKREESSLILVRCWALPAVSAPHCMSPA